MSGSLCLLDTSVCIEILRGNPLPEEWKAYRFGLSSVVEAELWAGVYHRGGERERRKVEKLLGATEIFPFESKAAEATGKVLGELANLGKPIGDFDSQIAGHALAHKTTLATRNPEHFARINGLKLLVW